ncbi:hypothetical protein RN001_004100, partial [Aquatica leii]
MSYYEKEQARLLRLLAEYEAEEEDGGELLSSEESDADENVSEQDVQCDMDIEEEVEQSSDVQPEEEPDGHRNPSLFATKCVMGCKLGKLATSSTAGNAVKRDDPPPPAPTDPRLPLSAKQKYTMVASWKGISRAMEPTGVHMFLRLFEEHEELLSLFAKFKELRTRDEQINSLELQEHAGTVMNTLDEGIRTLDNVDAFNDYLHQVGASHRKIPGFKVEYFW